MFFYPYRATVAQISILTLWQVQFTCPPTPTVAQISILTLWQAQFTCPPKFRFWLCDKFNSHVLLPLPWAKFRFWLCDKFNSHVFLPLPWPKFRFWLCDKFNSHVLLPLAWPNLPSWLCDKFNSHVLLPLDWPNLRFWLCDKFNSHALLPLPWPKFRFWHVQFTCLPTPTVVQILIMTLWQVQFFCGCLLLWSWERNYRISWKSSQYGKQDWHHLYRMQPPDILGNKNLSANEIHTSEISRPLKSNNEPKTKSTVPPAQSDERSWTTKEPKTRSTVPPHSSGKITKLWRLYSFR